MFIYYFVSAFLLILVASVIRKAGRYEDLCVGTFVLLFPLLLLSVAPLEGSLRPFTWDARLRQADLWLGLDGFALARLCFRTAWLKAILSVSYTALPVAFALHWVLFRSKQMLQMAVLGGLLAFPFYLLVPACGPQYAFAGYPWHTEVPSGLIAVATLHPRNCFPSMHLSWALLFALNAKTVWMKGLFWIYAVLIALATVGLGEHYAIDLIAAVPFTLAVQWLAVNFHVTSLGYAIPKASRL